TRPFGTGGPRSSRPEKARPGNRVAWEDSPREQGLPRRVARDGPSEGEAALRRGGGVAGSAGRCRFAPHRRGMRRQIQEMPRMVVSPSGCAGPRSAGPDAWCPDGHRHVRSRTYLFHAPSAHVATIVLHKVMRVRGKDDGSAVVRRGPRWGTGPPAEAPDASGASVPARD